MSLLPVEDALARLLALAPTLPVEQTPLAQAGNRRLAAPLHALRTQPAADLSAMDGYAIRHAELPGPWQVVGEAAAGAAPFAIRPGQAARIFTGAAMPAGADCVLIQEEAARDGDRLMLAGEGPPGVGAHVRPAASDFRAGDLLLDAGAILGPAAVALAAISGHGAVPVGRRPRIALISPGNELVPPGAPTTGVLLPASNAAMLTALLAHFPTEIVDYGIIPDQIDALSDIFRTVSDSADVIVTTGGASVGDHDLVRPALQAAGASIDFWRIAMKPGKPLLAGRIGDAVALGLPGNPVSALVTATIFLLPLVARLADAAHLLRRPRQAPLLGALPGTGNRQEYVRATGTCDGVLPLSGQDSAGLRHLPVADLLVLRPPHSAAVAAGTIVTVIPLA